MLPVALGSIARAELTRLLFQAWEVGRPEIAKLLSDPNGTVVRVGEALVWSGPTGQKVIGGLETLADSHARIESAVSGIQSAQLATQGVLGVVNAVSIATLGITSLTGAFMAYRLSAINKRIESLSATIKDVEAKVDADHIAYLRSGVQFLREYDESPSDKDKLHSALENSRHAANAYGHLAAEEANGAARLPVLNLRSRLYIISLLTELRCMMSSDDARQALERIDEESPNLKRVAQACFNQTLTTDPERYLRTPYQAHGVNLNLLANIYLQARQLQIIVEPKVEDANEMFEYVRGKMEKGEGYWAWLTRGKAHVDDEMQKLRYLLACLEETSRIEGLKLIISGVKESKGSLAELVGSLKEWRRSQSEQEKQGDAPSVFAYAV